MNTRMKNLRDLTLEDYFAPGFQNAIQTWHDAREAFVRISGKAQRDAYCAATDELGQSLLEFQRANPALAEIFKYFFSS